MRHHTLLVLFLLCSTSVLAQDSHYWTQQYGTKSMLLSGSVIGGVEDLGAVYYNPARLAVIKNPAFLLSANVYEYNSLTISDAFGNSKSATTSTFKGVPTLAAGTFKIKGLPKHFFAYAILTRQNSDISLSYSNEVHKDVIGALPGDEYFGAAIRILNNSSEQWTGLTWSYAPSPKFSVGVTTNFSLNKQSKGNQIQMQLLSAANEVASYRYNRTFGYSQSGFLWKIGAAADLGKWQLGLTINTPLVAISGSGNYTYEEFYSAVPSMLTPGAKPATYTSSYQKGIPMQYKSPWSVGFGATHLVGKNKIHFSTEWFSSISKYNVMSAASHVSQSNPADTIRFQLVDQLKSVMNAGIGAELYISEKVSGFASFSTDFTAAVGDMSNADQQSSEKYNDTWRADFYHVGGGVVLKLKGADITLGATHTGANMNFARPVNFPDNPNQPIFGTAGDTANARWDRWNFVFSFSFPFLNDYAKKFTEDK